jgi:type I restriction enzyme, S subunit
LTSELSALKPLVHLITKGTTPNKTQGYTEDGINFIRALSVDGNGQLDEETFLKISDETNNVLKRSIVQEGDVLVSIAGVIGRVTVVEKKHLPANLNQALAIIRPNKDQIRSRYLANLLRSHNAQFYLKSRVVESVQANLSLSELGKFPIEVLSLEEQNKRNKALELLEEMLNVQSNIANSSRILISSILRSWFIDFDPVKAKVEGKLPYGMDERTAALFPDSFEDSVLGSIPQRWSLETLGSLAINQSDSFDFSDKSKVIFINTGDVFNGDLLHSDFISTDGLPGQAKKAVKHDDILYSEIRPKNKRFAYLESEMVSEMVVSTKFMVIRAKNPSHQKFIFQHITMDSSINFFNYIAESRSGTFPQITFDSVKNYVVVMPPERVLNKFEELVKPMLNLINETKSNRVILSNLRDALLPRLMSGELKVN